MSIKVRQYMERQIVRQLVIDALAAGYLIAVNDGGEEFGPFSELRPILNACFSVDEEDLIFFKGHERFGWVRLVYGNDGWDVISDYTCNLEHVMDGANKLADKWQ